MRDHHLRPYVEAMVRASTLLLALMPVVPTRIMILLIGCWLGTLTLRLFTDPVPISHRNMRWALFLALPFALMLLDMLRATDPLATWWIVERSSSFLVFPLGFLVLGAPSSKRLVHRFMDVFTAACLVLLLFANSSILLGEDGARTFDDGYAYRHAFTAITGLHPPFAAYFLLAAALLQFDGALSGGLTWRRGAVVLLLLAGAALLGSRMPPIAFGAASGVMVFVRFGWKRALPAWGAVLILLVALAALLPSARQRMEEVIHHNKQEFATEFDPLHVRAVVNECAWQVTKQHWSLGVGQENAQRTLDDCYAGLGETRMLDGSYSTHDQLLHWWLCFGVAGAVLYVILFGTLIRSAARARHAAMLGFLVFMLICCCTENVLSRQWGLVLFACFTSMFVACQGEEEASAG